jgi:Zn-dependent peptidase ImmA (M78 family)
MALAPPEPENYARELLRAWKIDRAPDDLSSILDSLRLTVVEKDTAGFEGALVCRKDRSKGIVILSSRITERGRQKFTVCHEIGHFILPGHGEAGCQTSVIESWREGKASKETAANRFASELLLPTALVYPFVSKKKATIEAAKELCAEFSTSLTAAAYKLVDLTEEACAVVWSVSGQIKWFKKNDNFRDFLDFGSLDEQSLAASLSSTEREKSGEVYAETWLSGDHLSAKNKIWEDSIFLPSYQAVLSILTAV